MSRWIVVAAVLLPAAGSAQDDNQMGKRAFQRCFSCHAVEKGETGHDGPTLYALSRRAVAADPDFVYSPAFRDFAKRNPRWTAPLLDRFLTDPQSLVPRNKMGFFGLRDAESRAAIIAYIMASE